MKFLDPENLCSIPEHVAILMDGNRRWAKKRGFPSFLGHKRGAETLLKTVRIAAKYQVKFLTVYAFSTENWKRSKKEIRMLMHLLYIYLIQQRNEMLKEGVCLQFIGDINKLPNKIRKTLLETVEVTKNGKKITLVLALNYGGRDEIVRACKSMCKAIENKQISLDEIDEKNFSRFLDTKDLPDPDLVIRTSGEKRISNFLLWQLSYAEFVFSKTFWPEFKEKDFVEALMQYQERERRLGGEAVL